MPGRVTYSTHFFAAKMNVKMKKAVDLHDWVTVIFSPTFLTAFKLNLGLKKL